MDGENNGKPYEQMDDLGVFPYFWKHPYFGGVLPYSLLAIGTCKYIKIQLLTSNKTI